MRRGATSTRSTTSTPRACSPTRGVAGEVNYATYWNGTGIRSAAIDCRTTDSGGRCPAIGGYTYQDIRTLVVPHTAGEMWAQTLWSIRYEVGSATARQLVTDALRISPPDPTYIDQRDAIIAADLAVNDGANYEALWTVFADRGLGASATSPTRRRESATQAFDLPNVDVGDLRTNAETIGDRDGVFEPGESVELSPGAAQHLVRELRQRLDRHALLADARADRARHGRRVARPRGGRRGVHQLAVRDRRRRGRPVRHAGPPVARHHDDARHARPSRCRCRSGRAAGRSTTR